MKMKIVFLDRLTMSPEPLLRQANQLICRLEALFKATPRIEVAVGIK